MLLTCDDKTTGNSAYYPILEYLNVKVGDSFDISRGQHLPHGQFFTTDVDLPRFYFLYFYLSSNNLIISKYYAHHTYTSAKTETQICLHPGIYAAFLIKSIAHVVHMYVLRYVGL